MVGQSYWSISMVTKSPSARHIETLQGEAQNAINVMLTPAEARELRDSLDDLLDAGDPVRHHHVSSLDFQTEITLVVAGP